MSELNTTGENSVIRYWKIAPGEDAWQWKDCRENGFIAVGWDEIGDVSRLSKTEFESKRSKLDSQYEGWGKVGLEQLWKFAHNIKKGDRIVANRGTTTVLGIGTVVGPYYFVNDEDFGHRLPVKWDDLKPRLVKESGWRRTLIELDREKFERILNSTFSPQIQQLSRSYWIFQSNPKYYDLEKNLEGIKEEDLDNFNWTVNQYANQIQTGDVAYLWTSGKDAGILAVATVISDPYYMSEVDEEFISDKKKEEGKQQWVDLRIDHILPERIRRDDLIDHPTLGSMQIIRRPQGTNFMVTNEEAEALNALINRKPPEVYSLHQLAEDTGFDLETLDRWVRAIRRKGQAVLYGPPGTGKTYVAEHLARYLIGGEDGFTDLVQFHPAYAYEDFIQGIRPQSDDDGGLSYPIVPGRFLEFCERAESRRGTCVLIIDEINRANLSQVFGELMYLLEYRSRSIPLAGGRRLGIPENVLIIGTMNTADRSIALVDHALRRRFAFLRLQPNHKVLLKYHQSRNTGFPVEGLIGVLRRLNAQINDPHYEVGISFFLQDDLDEEIEDIWKMEIEPYLDEYFFDRSDKAEEFRWDKVDREIAP
ncbi:AAA family ATPase [Methanotrichaceae archaeon M04Ac]|uniref:AAA family ATPase n=1 Tax=Candidatus Methanocrinis alkalitolerans TaxID=3033395 RepID=A0ABT5XF92_9EURY|nr:AAA family ATPase [Candidatus Methanocrinis alkalitolerans]MDF0593386.1 AAA family ATPase [Candidatus Methanocrinis alkalitolerans]